jgi:adenylate cyclase
MKKKILVVDDDLDMVEVLVRRLEANGYEVVTAADGREGLLRLPVDKPDLIIADVMMPQMDGFLFVQEIKRTEGFSQTPIIVLTGKELMAGIFKSEGIKDYLLKPFDAEKLLDTIEKYI